MSTIEVKGLSFGYTKETPVLKNINISIKPSSLTAILGKNGCGKSTLLDCIIGYNQTKTGNIFINGKDLHTFSDKQLATEIAYIPQNTVSNMDFTVEEFILFGRNCRLKFGDFLKQEDYDIVHENARLLGVDNLLSKSIHRISGGERQLAYIARALTQESPIIIMDEPTANLDFGNQAVLFSIMKDLQQKGKTVLFTTHNPNHVMDLGCELIGIKDGAEKYAGSASDVMSVDMIKDLYGEKFEVEFDGKHFVIKAIL